MSIPPGKVATYGQISLGCSGSTTRITPRLVGRLLHQNPDPDNIPCHRVVDRNGRISDRYAFGGAPQQRRRLLHERVAFKDMMHVDLTKHIWGEIGDP